MSRLTAVIGLPEWNKAIDRAFAGLQTEVKTAVYKRGQQAVTEAIKLAPTNKNPDGRTSQSPILRQSIKGKVLDQGYTHEITASAINPVNGYNYAFAQEYGNAITRAQPYVQPAIDKAAPELKRDLERIGRKFSK